MLLLEKWCIFGEMSSDFTDILHEMTGKVHEQNHEGSFVTVYRKIGHNAAPTKNIIFALTDSLASRY